MQYVVLGLLVLYVIGFFVVVWKAAQNWRWYHIVAAIFTLLLAVGFLFPTAGVLKSRSAWHQVKEKLDKQFVQVSAEQHRLKYGDSSNPDSVQGIVRLNRMLAKMGMEAGRRWRNIRQQTVNNQSITLSAPAPAEGIPGEPAAAAPTLPMIPNGLVVYGFAETPNDNQVLLPSFYLGEFVVTASTPNSVTIEPTTPLEESQQQAIQSGQAASWSLYELLPLDGNSIFIAEGSIPSDENFLGRVNEELLNQLLADRIPAETLQSYLRDGSRSTQDDPPVSRWTKVEFDKSESFDVDADGQRSALDGGLFDGIGRAVDGRLQKGGAVEFKKGDQIVLKEEEADRLIASGSAHLVDQYYLRPLNDYRYVLRHIRMRLTELANRAKTLQFEQGVLQTAADKTQALLVDQQEKKLKLEQDFVHFRTEKQAIGQYAELLQTRAQQMQAEMKRLYDQNIALEQQLRMQHGAGAVAIQ